MYMFKSELMIQPFDLAFLQLYDETFRQGKQTSTTIFTSVPTLRSFKDKSECVFITVFPIVMTSNFGSLRRSVGCL